MLIRIPNFMLKEDDRYVPSDKPVSPRIYMSFSDTHKIIVWDQNSMPYKDKDCAIQVNSLTHWVDIHLSSLFPNKVTLVFNKTAEQASLKL